MANIYVLANIRLLSAPAVAKIVKAGKNMGFAHMDKVSIQTKESGHIQVGPGIEVARSAWTEAARGILTDGALETLAAVHREFQTTRVELLERRAQQQQEFDKGTLPDYLDKQSAMVTGDWQVAPIPSDYLRRRVEITGPVNSAKMVINMLSRNEDGERADCAMLDFEDSMKPSWDNVIQGVHNVIGAAKGSLSFTDSRKPDREYALDPNDMANVMVRVRGLHLNESNIRIDGEVVSAGLFDFVMCFYHSGAIFVGQGKTPKFYIPKCEHHLEAKWWNDLFTAMEERMNLPVPSLRATFLIETLPAAFQMEEILFQFRNHAAGLNGGRWDKIFSDIKTLKFHPDRVMADRASIDMSRSWMSNYAKRIIEICHRRGAFAMGGMSAFTPGKEPEVREEQLAKVTADKRHEASIGHDGCWVSHPYFIGPAMQEFKTDNQLERYSDLEDKYPSLLPEAIGPKTEVGLRKNIRVGIAYLYGWIQDIGCVAWDNMMEDLATLEISRAQVWQWLYHGTTLDCGTKVTRELVTKLFEEEYTRIMKEGSWDDTETALWNRACEEAKSIFLEETFREFLCTDSEVATEG